MNRSPAALYISNDTIKIEPYYFFRILIKQQHAPPLGVDSFFSTKHFRSPKDDPSEEETFDNQNK